MRAQEYAQVSCGKEEFLDQLRLGHILEPVCLALFGNSVIGEGADQNRCAGAQYLQDQLPLEDGRCGMFVTPPKNMDEYFTSLSERKSLLLRDQGMEKLLHGTVRSLLAEHD